MSEVSITEIKTTKKGRYALFCDDGFLFSVDDETLLRHGLKEGSTLSGEELLLVREASDYQKAKNKALDYLGLRDHSEGELYTKLKRSFDEHTAAAAVAKIKELGLTDDGAFARNYAYELIERKGASTRAAADKLREKGIAKETIAEALAPYDNSDADRAAALIEKKYSYKLAMRSGRDAVKAALARRGFSMRDIREALSRFDENGDAAEEYDYTEEE